MEENSNLPPIYVFDSRDVTEVSVHRDVELGESEFESLNSTLERAGISPIGSRRTKLTWATPTPTGEFWEFEIEFYTLPARERASPQLHLMLVSNKSTHTKPTAYKRSRRTVNKAGALVNVLFGEGFNGTFDCSVTLHSLSDSWLLPQVLPVRPGFTEESTIQEVTGVIGGSTDGLTKFVVDRVRNEPMMFHIWLSFKGELSLSRDILVEAIAQGVAMLEDINLWGK